MLMFLLLVTGCVAHECRHCLSELLDSNLKRLWAEKYLIWQNSLIKARLHLDLQITMIAVDNWNLRAKLKQ